MRKLLLAVMALSFTPLSAATYYVRTDGGTSVQCTGTTNAAYTGGTSAQWTPSTVYALGAQVSDANGNLDQVTTAGTSAVKYPPIWSTTTGGTIGDGTVTWTNEGPMPSGQACAVNNLYWLGTHNSAANQFNPFVWVTATGDTIQFEDVGPYYEGLYNGVSGLGIYWQNCIADSLDCHMPVPPNGTHILGLGAGSCHDSAHLNHVNSAKLVAVNDLQVMFTLHGSSNLDIECIDITQGSVCTRSGTGAGKCTSGTSDLARVGIRFEDYAGDIGPNNLTLKDVGVYGLAGDGTQYSFFTGTTTLTDLYLEGNGDAGFNGASDCTTNCESTGTINAAWLLIEWNGCIRVSPGVYNYCFDDVNAGYGDGMAWPASNATMNVSHGRFFYNTQDGFDAFHFNDDLTSSPVVNLTTSESIGNEGATFKAGGATVTAWNNYSSGNCRVLATASNFPSNPTGWNAGIGNPCRASGDEWSIVLNNGHTVTLQDNTSTGYGATMYDFSCVPGGTCTTGTVLAFQNNSNLGFGDSGRGGALPGGIDFSTSGMGNPFANAGSVISNNLWYNMLSGTCPQSSHETAYLCTSPLMAAQSSADAVNPNLTSSSPGIGQGLTISGITTDFNGTTRLSPPAIGAYEFNPPPAPTYMQGCVNSSSAASVTCTPSSAARAGDLLVIATKTAANATAALTVTTTAGPSCTWSTLPVIESTGTFSATIGYCVLGSAGTPTIQATWAGGGGTFTDIAVGDYAPGTTWAASPLDVSTSSNNASSATCTTGTTGSTANAQELVVGACFNFNVAQTWGGVTGYTQRPASSRNTTGWWDLVTATAGTQSLTTAISTDSSVGYIAAFMQLPAAQSAIGFTINGRIARNDADPSVDSPAE